MDAWRDIRLAARELHAKALVSTSGDRRAPALLRAALGFHDLEVRRFQPGTRAGTGVFGFLDRPAFIVHVAAGQEVEDEAVVIAHEIGHFELHRDPRNDVTIIAPGLGGDKLDGGVAAAQGYSPKERKEIQADVFAGEFLCPSDWLREQIIGGRRDIGRLAKDLGLPSSLLMNQAVRALLLPPLRPRDAAAPAVRYELDPSQRRAAEWRGSPLLVDAGPGTGKTRTLVHRLERLINEGTRPSSILALTFTNKAAEEMRERICAMNPRAAIEMWTGTFHAFGWELLAKHAERIGRTINIRLLDEAGCLALLDNNLTRLNLRYYLNIYDPALELREVLRAISRCKDELISWEEYKAEAEAACASTDPDVRDKGERALEVAAIYQVYEELLVEYDVVDFGDLVRLPAQLLEQNADIADTYRGTYAHILVDEYQDVNLASARFLRSLCTATTEVWVVADARQSIYRFRGAEPGNVSRFTDEFGGETLSLNYNYRSVPAVVGAFGSFARTMPNGASKPAWTATRTDAGGVSIVVAPDTVSEAAAIKESIEALRAKGVGYEDQVILARSHLTLARICGPLERMGIPLLYLGDLFERDEVRDLQSLLALDAEYGGVALLRVARFDEYAIPRADVIKVLSRVGETGQTVFEVLERLDDVQDLTQEGRKGLALLWSHLEGMGPATSPWTMLSVYLIERSKYLDPLLQSNDAKSQQSLIAIYQFLKVCSDHPERGHGTRRRLLERIRRLEALNDERIFRAVSSEASDLDAVRVMTIHGSKGLEFRAVHLPGLATGYLPARAHPVRCPPPPTLPSLQADGADHTAEEECLFFVALSRARDHLCISRAEKYTAVRKATASAFIARVAGAQDRQHGTVNLPEDSTVPVTVTGKPVYTERELNTYMQCPRRFRYEFVDGLKGGARSSGYVKFHGCVYRTIAWLEDERAKGTPVDAAAALAQLQSDWTERGPAPGGFEPFYRKSADAMVRAMATLVGRENGGYERNEWSIAVGGRNVSVTPDRVVIGTDGTVRIQRIRTGRQTKSEADSPLYALLRAGAAALYGARRVSVETLYAADAAAIPVPVQQNEAAKVNEYRDAIAGIENGYFPQVRSDRHCPSCPYYFICGA
jgi:superfamily I DNA/RNA helicase